MMFRKISLTLLTLALGVSCAYAKKKAPKYEQAHPLTPEQSALVEKAIGQEKVLIKAIQERTPLVETYIQDTRPDVKLYQVPIDDQYTLSRVDFGKGFFDKTYEPRDKSKHGFFKGSFAAITGLSKSLGLDKRFTYNPTGFMQMMFLDPSSFDSQHYEFSYVRKEFLGAVRTWVFDVHPKINGMGRFYGRIWVEDQDGNVVRFNGTYTGPSSADDSRYYFHFDSWRMNVQPGIWLPVAIYVEESNRGDSDKPIGLKAQTHFWGYSLKLPTRDSENVSMKIEDAEDKSDDSQDVSPLQASRAWLQQAENNVIDRLEEAGLVAPLTPNGFETQVLDQIVVNLAVPNNLQLASPVHCRVLLSTTVEATTVGNTILLSKGLIDSLPRSGAGSEASIASVVSVELAHIAMGHHIDTRYAFNDRLLFPDEATFRRIEMNHSDIDDASAAKRGMEFLQASMYKDKLPDAGLFWEQLADRGKQLRALNTPMLGDSLLKPDGTPWMSDLSVQAPKINWDDLTQIPASPLGSWLKTDPWDDKVHMLNAKIYAPLNPRDKMPLEVTPIYFKLQRYETASATPPPPAPGAAPAPAPTDQPATAPPAQTTPPPPTGGEAPASSPTQGVSNPPPAN
ncbi:MAG TPA: hypothetical protein VHZ28_04790 [Terracidiphilus sp.]|nr:hypothetical protein [Terracidiphilus sp.]